MKSDNNQFNLILQQKKLLKKIYSQGDSTWKILIFDNFNRQIISSLYKMKDLRQNNITLYMNIKQKRQKLHGVTAIYLIQPTQQNIQLILHDFQQDLYSTIVIHFSSEPINKILSTLAKQSSKIYYNVFPKINRIQYSNLGFQTISKNMAIAQQNKQLINLITLMKNKPLFVYGPKQQQQVKFIKQILLNSGITQKQQKQKINKQNYNIVLFYNRQNDYFPVLSHSISYAGLIQSIYKFSSNGKKIIKGKSKEQNFEIDLNDQTWVERRNLATSQLGLNEQLNAIKIKLMNEKDRLNQINELSQRQKKIQNHMTMVSDLIRQASSRKLNQYYECQMEIYTKKVLNSQLKKQVLILLETTNNSNDKIRLILIILLYCEHIDTKQIQEFQLRVPQIKKSKFFNDIKSKIQRGQNSNSGGMIGGASKMLKKFSIGLINNLKGGDKFLLTRYVQKLMNLKQNDLKQLGLSMNSTGDIPQDVKPQNILIYCIGGACLHEESNLSKFFDGKITYIGDKMINAIDLI